ncbi:MAG: class I SAM-dependent methyltransferase family protein [Candidatus Aenigmarchaeota archaeon]|nr:class I SAM-dependent methyltransferase family protein [Candidatus Aenigmarchaeota archaeon]
MSFKDIISLASGVSLEKIPDGYQTIGNIMLLKFFQTTGKKERKTIADTCLKTFSNIETVCEINGIEGEFRIPKTTILASRISKPTLETTHTENGIKFKIDVGKIMFSKGNLSERQRLIGMIQKGETIVDMFAGIGYFSLGLAKHSPANRIYAVEKNRKAFDYLKQNIKLNGIRSIEPKRGDCRKIRIREKADRVIMGYFPGTEKFLPHAFKFLKERGVVHYHNLYSDKELWEKPLKDVEKAARKSGYRIVSITGRNVVKSYAPGIWHTCLDFAAESVS